MAVVHEHDDGAVSTLVTAPYIACDGLGTYLAIVAIRPAHRNTTLAIPLALCLYTIVGVSFTLAMAAASAAFAEIEALPVARMTVKAIASARHIIETTTALILHAHRIFIGSHLFGKKRSKKKPAPNIVATAMPTKMLNDAIPTKSSLWTLAEEWSLSICDCCFT